MFEIGGCWLTPGEQEEVISKLIEWGIIKWDNLRSLKLKSGGLTDIYINLRDMRSNPEAIRFLANIYANVMRRLGVKRFIEVPEAVSPLAGAISMLSDIPMVTVREEAKPGRVVTGKFVGAIGYGESVALMDDVITDGFSKLAALREIQCVGSTLAALVVMVDRQQGWRKMLPSQGFPSVPVWPGMTLHDIRRYLVEHGLMQRCDSAVEEKNPIIVACDGKSWEELLPTLDQLRTTGCILKVNDLLWDLGLEWLLPNLEVYGRVMADLKGHDIPNTLENICKRLRKCPPWAVTVHASGGKAMIEAAKKALEGTPTKVLAVTVLTSIDPDTCQEIYRCRPMRQVLKLAEIAITAGADGFVCSPQEVKILSVRYPDKLRVTPGVRSPGKDVGDQKRTDTPANAMKYATQVVMGRQVLGAQDPVAEVKRVLKDELGLG